MITEERLLPPPPPLLPVAGKLLLVLLVLLLLLVVVLLVLLVLVVLLVVLIPLPLPTSHAVAAATRTYLPIALRHCLCPDRIDRRGAVRMYGVS